MRHSIAVPALTLALATVAQASGGGEEIDGASLVTPDIGLMFWTFVTFGLLLVLLGRFAWKPLLSAIEARERSIRESIDQARAERDEAAKLLDEHKALVAQARRERAEAAAEGQRDAERLKGQIVEEGRQQRERLLSQAEAQIAAEMQKARAELRGAVADLSIRVAERLLAKNLDDPAQRKLVEDYLDDLDRRPDGPSVRPS
jgi:F-type H+-transporting ATPase subunit b